MSEIDIIADGVRRCRPVAEKPRIVEETLSDGESIAVVARRNGVGLDLLYRWCKLILERSSIAVTGDDSVTRNKTVRELARQLGRKTLENEMLKETLDRSGSKKLSLLAQSLKRGDLP